MSWRRKQNLLNSLHAVSGWLHIALPSVVTLRLPAKISVINYEGRQTLGVFDTRSPVVLTPLWQSPTLSDPLTSTTFHYSKVFHLNELVFTISDFAVFFFSFFYVISLFIFLIFVFFFSADFEIYTTMCIVLC